MRSTETDDLQFRLNQLIEQALAEHDRWDVYVKVRAGRIFGIVTVDAGRVRNCDVCRITVFDHANSARWFVGPEYEYYVTLPEIDGVWRTEPERSAYLHSLYTECKALKAAIDSSMMT